MALPLTDIVMPVYQEGDNIVAALERIAAEVTVPYRLTLVYDRDDDNTLPPARAAGERLGVSLRLEKNHYGRGVLKAIITGLEAAEGDFVVVTMADLCDQPGDINRMVELASDGGYDLVCASRYMRGGRQIGGPLLKRTLSRLAGVSLHYLTGLPTHDVTNSFKLYRRSLLRAIRIESDGGFELGMELVVKAHAAGFRIGEVPTCWVDRVAGESRFRLMKWLPKYLRWYGLALRHAWNPFRGRRSNAAAGRPR